MSGVSQSSVSAVVLVRASVSSTTGTDEQQPQHRGAARSTAVAVACCAPSTCAVMPLLCGLARHLRMVSGPHPVTISRGRMRGVSYKSHAGP